MKNKSNWYYYGVKIIKQIIVEGEPDLNLIDEFYNDDEEQLFEESIMLVHAQSENHAYKIAESKATKRWENEFHPNMYGQQVAWKFIKAVDCFLIVDKLKSGAEVYSCFHVTQKDITANQFIEKWFNRSNECKK